MSINLLQFCDPEAVRYAMSKPWLAGDRVQATDGRILVQVDAALFPDIGKPDGRVPRVDDIFTKFDAVAIWSPMPDMPSCDNCDSTGQLFGDCEFCKGGGGCVCGGGHEHECGACNGTGKEYLKECPECLPIICGRRIKRYFADKMATLPNVVVGGATDDPTELLYFKFDGGRGAVCPTRDDV